MFNAPIFLYSSWRTGGTAFALALKKDNMLFIDPLNPGLMDFQSAQNATTEGWSSNHPPGFLYFEEYLPLMVDGKLDHFPNLNHYKFRNSPEMFRSQLIEYVAQLIEHAKCNKKSAIFKFEQLEGHVDLLRRNFPGAIHIGLIRNPLEQCDSWFEQLALGNSHFFDAAMSLIKGDPEFFEQSSSTQVLSNQEIFDVYYSKLLSVRVELDATLNLYEDSREDFISNLPSDYFKEIFTSAFRELEGLEKQPTSTVKYKRMKIRAIELTQQRDELTQQRDELTQQRDELTQQRDELTQQRDELVNSTIWRFSKPLRDLINFLKG
jgi:hypothetical protein